MPQNPSTLLIAYRSELDTPTTPAIEGRIQALDGLRGLAALTVIFSHALAGASPERFPRIYQLAEAAGTHAVELFFVLSGFLITRLIDGLPSNPKRKSLKHFYFRRAAKLCPSLLLYLGVLFLLESYAPISPSAWSCYVTGLSFTQAFFENCGFHFGHLGSLTVEEMFYAVWPTIVLAFTVNRACGLKPVVGTIFLCSMLRVFLYFQSPSLLSKIGNVLQFADHFLIGAFVFWISKYKKQECISKPNHVTRLLGFSVVIYLFRACFVNTPILRAVLVGIGPSLVAISSGILLYLAVHAPQHLFSKLISSKILSEIGKSSYSIYLFQQLILGPLLLPSHAIHPMLVLFYGILAIFPGFALFHVFESPVQRKINALFSNGSGAPLDS